MADISRKKKKNKKRETKTENQDSVSVSENLPAVLPDSNPAKKTVLESFFEWVHDRLPGGNYRRLSKIIDKHNERLQHLKGSILKQRTWWQKLKTAFDSKQESEDKKTILQLESDVRYLKIKLKWLGTWGVIISFLIGFASSTVVFSSLTGKFVSSLLEKNANLEEDISGTDLAIVIADDARKTEKGHFASEILDHNSLMRLTSAMQFSKTKNIPIMLAGSQEAIDAMRNTAINIGMSTDMIYVEKASGNVKEKAINSKNECHDRNIKSPVIFTTAYKMPRTLCEFRRQGLNVKPFPVSKSNLGMNSQTITDAVEYNPTMVKAATIEYVKYIFSGCVFM